jgi:hypothetical protein
MQYFIKQILLFNFDLILIHYKCVISGTDFEDGTPIFHSKKFCTNSFRSRHSALCYIIGAYCGDISCGSCIVSSKNPLF